MFEPLAASDPKDGKVTGVLAQSWELSADGTTYTFKIRQNVKWHDGRPLTADDVKFTIDTIKDPKTRTVRKNDVDLVKEVTVTAPDTVKVTLSGNDCAFLGKLENFGIIP